MGVVAIVDPISTGVYLAEEFAARGWRSIAVLSTPEFPDALNSNLRPDDFDEVIVYDGNLEKTAERLQSHGVEAVVPGAEIGVELADSLSDALGCPGNGMSLSAARRDKYAMVEAVRRAGLRTARSFETDDVEQLVAWASQSGLTSVVVKPVASAGCDSVSFCHDEQAIREAFALVQGSVSSLGLYNATALAQELLVGEQYFVNSISRGGRHFINEIWSDRRHFVGTRKIFDYDDLLPPSGELQDALAEYTKSVLSALGISNGPAHTELMLTEAGPVLIETGARMQGAILPSAHVTATGHSQVSLTVESVVSPDDFDKWLDQQYSLRNYLRVIWLIAPLDGEVSGGPAFDELSGLPSVIGVSSGLYPGAQVTRTVDLWSTPGYIYLSAPTIDEVERDHRRIRELERSGLFQPR